MEYRIVCASSAALYLGGNSTLAIRARETYGTSAFGLIEYSTPQGSLTFSKSIRDMPSYIAAQQISDRVVLMMDSMEAHTSSLSKVVVNIGANDGVSLDPVFDLYATRDCSGVCIDYEDHYIEKLSEALPPNVDIIIEKVTPDNILDMISAYKDIDVVSIDIDSYDYFILEKIVTVKPKLILIEVNVDIPPGIFFARKYTENYVPGSERSCYGCSIDAVAHLAEKGGYKLVSLDWQTAFLLRDDVSSAMHGWERSPQEHYCEGYAERRGREQVFYHQGEESMWFELPVEEALLKFKDLYKNHLDDIILELTE